MFDLTTGVGRYRTTFGSNPREWYWSVGASLRIARVRAGVRFNSTKLGLGSGYGVSGSFESMSTETHMPAVPDPAPVR